jgi:glycogen phosphorylase
MKYKPKIAYLSMEIGFNPEIPTYSGGLGILAGDFLKSGADMGVPIVGISLMYRGGYFNQNIIDGQQIENYPLYNPRRDMTKLENAIVSVPIANREVKIVPWMHELKGNKSTIPLLFLDTHVYEKDGKGNQIPLNKDWDEALTNNLYGGDHQYHRLAQEVILGIGGIKVLEKLGIKPEVYHLNEGHGAFAVLELEKIMGKEAIEKTVFTTHTPVPAGHDKFDYGLAHQVIGKELPSNIKQIAGNDSLNMTLLALNKSRYANGVAKEHGEVSQIMFPDHDIDSITNGVHSYTWTSQRFQDLFDKYIPKWREHPEHLADVDIIPEEELLDAHLKNRYDLVNFVNEHNSIDSNFDPNIPIIGFARRFVTYKRGDLIFYDTNRLLEVAEGKLQFLFAGKAHPKDNGGKNIIHNIINKGNELKEDINVGFIPDYNMGISAIMTPGSDAWMNTPVRPREASGTSGMKAAHNGVPHLSIIDGWWYEAQPMGGWNIGPEPCDFKLKDIAYKDDAYELYNVLEREVIPDIQDLKRYVQKIKESIKNASFFNSHRQMDDYMKKAY